MIEGVIVHGLNDNDILVEIISQCAKLKKVMM